jgi:hypothetical protein
VSEAIPRWPGQRQFPGGPDNLLSGSRSDKRL